MKSRRAQAVELLMSYSDAAVAEMLGMSLETLRRWAGEPEFAEALNAREREQKRALARIARQAALRAAETLCQVAGEQSKPDAKALLDILKASGAFEAQEEDPAEAIAAAVREAARVAEAGEANSGR